MAVRVLLLSILQWHFLLRLMRHALCILRRVFSCVSCILFLPVIKKKKTMAVLHQQHDGRSLSGVAVFRNHASACVFRREIFSFVSERRNEGSDVEVRDVCLQQYVQRTRMKT